MKWLPLIFCAALLAATLASAGAAPSFFGPTGLIVMPTTDTLAQGQCELFLNYVDRDSYEETPYGLSVGLGKGLELGITAVHENGDSAGTRTIVNAKWTALSETATRPAVAIGAINAATNKDFRGTLIIVPEDGEMCPFIVASKKILLPGSDLTMSGHVGYIGGMLDAMMLGANAQVSPRLEVMADWINNFTHLSIGARYQATDSINVNLGLLDSDPVVGVSYKFGLK